MDDVHELATGTHDEVRRLVVVIGAPPDPIAGTRGTGLVGAILDSREDSRATRASVETLTTRPTLGARLVSALIVSAKVLPVGVALLGVGAWLASHWRW